MVCHLDDVEKITSVWYDDGVLSVTTEKGTGSMHLPKGLDKADVSYSALKDGACSTQTGSIGTADKRPVLKGFQNP